jgi:hypothetical protein
MNFLALVVETCEFEFGVFELPLNAQTTLVGSTVSLGHS